MRVMFARSDDGRLCSWWVELPGHRRVQGSTKAGPDLDAMPTRWRVLRSGDELVVQWPTRRLRRLAPRVRSAPARRRVRR